jgi:hypothetical protein
MESDMIKMANLDDKISIIDQLVEDESPVVLVNVFTVDPGEADRVMGLDEGCRIHEASTRVHLDAASPRYRH